jgi:Zn-dependent peptidase ImmA (M78 family)
MHAFTPVDIAAEQLRNRALLLSPPISTKRLIAACFPGVHVAGATLRKGLYGYARHTLAGPIIVYSRSLPILEQRMTIAHEIGHLYYHDLEHGPRLRSGVVFDRALEDRAEAFARELLAPITMVAKHRRRFPSEDEDENEIYLDHVDELGALFMVPAAVIDHQIRCLARQARLPAHR